MYVVGTAGHVDHGKSTLVQALTGMDPDRLVEEKAREMTIDLGFAWLELGNETIEEVGVVDVPGHRDFIENMLAGVGGIDVALFVVAADEGVMPQTKEHLAILDLLEIRGGIVALTKVDMVADDPDWLELVTLDIEEAIQDTVLAGSTILPVSARTGAGIDKLKQLLWEKLADAPPRPDNGRPRLPVDRVFTLSGFGTVVTGTLLDGRFQIGDNIEIQPSGKTGRVRGLQTHKTKLDIALPGSRVAVNLTGIDRDEVKRGDVVAGEGIINRTILFDGMYRHLAEATTPLKHNMEVKLFVGAKEVLARTRVLGVEQIEVGQEGWLQLATVEDIAVVRGDRYILRRPSPGETLGGGQVLDPHPGRRHRRFKPETIERMKTLSAGTPEEMLLQALRRIEPTAEQALLQSAGLEKDTAVSALENLKTSNQVLQLDTQLITYQTSQKLKATTENLLTAYHKEYPLRLGIPREEVRSRLKLKANVFNPLIDVWVTENSMVEEGTFLHLPSHQVRFSAAQQTKIDQLMQIFSTSGVNSPSVKEAQEAVGENVYFALVDLNKLQPISKDVVYPPTQLEKIVAQIVGYCQENGRINAAQTRDLLGTSRKYAISLLEYLDQTKVTRRIDDDRVLTKQAS
mgnify:CR=1 FL=1